MSDAAYYVDEAIDALTNTMWRSETQSYVDLKAVDDPLQRSVSMDLDQINGALGGGTHTLLYALAREIDRAVIALVAAKQQLEHRK
jgi:hypothetical protein